MKQKMLVLASSLFLALCSFGQAKLVEKVTKTGNEIVIPYEKYVLPNGLTVIVSEDHSDPIVYVDVTYHVGSSREQIGKSGFAHFFEHMMFQGSDHIADGQHIKMVTEAGGTMNGSTTEDRTNYFETVPSNQLEKFLWAESDRMGFLLDAVSQKKFEIQRSTVKNERGQRIDNVPYGLLGQLNGQVLYPYGHPYSWPVIGYLEDLNRSDVNDLKNFFLRWYGPNNATLTIVGDVTPANAVKLAEKYFGSIARGPEVAPVSYPPVVLDKTRYASYTDNYARLPLLRITYPTVPNYHKDMAALEALAQFIGQGKNSALYQNIVKKQLAIQASSFSRLNELAGEFSIIVVPTPGKTLSDMEKLVRASLDSFEAKGISDDDIAKFKGSKESQLINGLQSVQGKGVQLAAFQTFTGNPNKIADLLKSYSSLTKEDVIAAYNKYIRGKYSVVLSVLPKGQENLVAAADNYTIDSTHYTAPNYGYAGLKYVKAKDNFDRTKIPVLGPNPIVKVPKFWRKDLPNGAKVIGSETNEVPTVTMSITIPGGHLAQANNLSKAGLAGFFADMMTEDTKSYTAEKMTQELQKLGASINVSSGIDGVTFTLNTLKKNLDKAIILLQERMLNPKFTQDAFDRQKKQALESFKLAKSQPATIASNVFAKVNYGPNNILGIDENGTEETVKNITLDDIQGYYNNYMTSQDAKVVIVGDIKQEDALAILGFISKLPKKKITLPSVNPAPVVAKTQVYLVDVPKSAQTEFRIGYATGLKWDATGDYFKANLANFILGGDFSSRLNLSLREGHGWTYDARSSFSGDQYSGDFQFSSGIKVNATDSALAETMKIINEIVKEGVKDDELSFIKKAVGQRDALRYETNMQKAAFIRRILDYNLPANYVEAQAKILQSMTKEQLTQVVQKYVRPDKMNILLVGDKAKIIEGVKKLGYPVVELDADGKPIDKKAF
ncbi:MAG: peptidase M16 [Chitinophagaceae bacterium]